MPDNKTFKKAFREAKNAGKKTFIWNNKSYHTKTKEEESFDLAKKKGVLYKSPKAKTSYTKTKTTGKWETWEKKRNGGFLLPPSVENID